MNNFNYGDLQSVEFIGMDADLLAEQWQDAMMKSNLTIEVTDQTSSGSRVSRRTTLYYYILTPQETTTEKESLVERFSKECDKKYLHDALESNKEEYAQIMKNKFIDIAENVHKTEKHKEICDKLNQVYADKNSDYGDSFAISYYLFGMTGVLQRLFDKWIRMYMLQYKSQKVNDESIVDSLRDLTNYSIMTLIELENDNPNDPARRLAEALKELAGIK